MIGADELPHLSDHFHLEQNSLCFDIVQYSFLTIYLFFIFSLVRAKFSFQTNYKTYELQVRRERAGMSTYFLGPDQIQLKRCVLNFVDNE